MIEEKEFIEITTDTAFKYLYKNEKYRPWFNDIIKAKFNIDLSDYKLVDNELNTGNRRKDYRLDIRLEKDNTMIIIEMNKDYYDFIENKNYQYLYRLAGKGERYSNKEVKLILFNNFKNKEIKDLKTGNFVFQDPINKLTIKDIESYEIYLPNFKEICYHKVNKEDISLSLFTCKSYEEMLRNTKNKVDIEIINELERLAMDNEFKMEYDEEAVIRKTQNSIRYEGHQEGFEEGFEEGREEGKKEGKIGIAKQMIKDNQTFEIISKYTGLSIEEIEKLKQ